MNISAADSYYLSLINDMERDKRRTEQSKAAYEAGSRKFWIYKEDHYCPVCGNSDVYRQRMYTPKPEKWEERFTIIEYYDWCEG
jgi:hypothetical protein